MATAKTENHLHVTIPTYFKCPISLDLMKSPVSLSTGITYDRSSIQSWLDNGNTTCPATMQPLSSPSFVPNLTLHRLIHLWSHSHSSSVSSSPSPRSLLSLLMPNPEDITASLKKIHDKVRVSEANRKVLDDSDEFLESLTRLIDKSDDVVDLELICLIVERFSEARIREMIGKSRYLEKLVLVLRNGGSADAKLAVARIVSAAAEAENDAVIETEGLVPELYRNLVESDLDGLIEAGLTALITVAGTKPVKNELVELGMVRRLREILCDTGRVEINLIERIMEMIELIATCADGRAAICEDEECVVEVVRRLMKVSEKATEHGVTVLWSVCYLFRDDRVKEIVGKRSNGLGKCLLLLQSNCKTIVKQMCRDLVKVLKVDYSKSSSKSCLGGYETKTTHIMPY